MVVYGEQVLFYIILIAVFIFIIVATIILLTDSSDDPDSGTVANIPQCSSKTGQLPDISNQECCSGQGRVKFNSTLQVNMGPSPVYYQNVCKQFCPSGSYNTDTDTCNTSSTSVINNVNNCVSATKPSNCNGLAQPIAVSNGTPYYAQVANLQGCTTTPCDA